MINVHIAKEQLKLPNLHRKEASSDSIVETKEKFIVTVDEDNQLGILIADVS